MSLDICGRFHFRVVLPNISPMIRKPNTDPVMSQDCVLST